MKTVLWKIVGIFGIGLGVASQVSSQGSSGGHPAPGVTAALKAFQCDRLSDPILLSRTSSGWAVGGLDDDVSADEFDMGFRLTSLEDPNFLGFLRQTGGSWSLMLLSPSGTFESECKSIDEIVSWVLSEATSSAIEDAYAALMQSQILELEVRVETLQQELTEAHASLSDVAALEHQIITLQSKNDALTSRLDTLDEALRNDELSDWAREMLSELERLPRRLDLAEIGIPTVPPLTAAEREILRSSVIRCWVVDPASDASRVTTTVAFEMDPEGRVFADSIVMLGNSGGSANAIDNAFEAARRAILRCQSDGYSLPPEKFEQWRYVEMTFNPSEMRIR